MVAPRHRTFTLALLYVHGELVVFFNASVVEEYPRLVKIFTIDAKIVQAFEERHRPPFAPSGTLAPDAVSPHARVPLAQDESENLPSSSVQPRTERENNPKVEYVYNFQSVQTDVAIHRSYHTSSSLPLARTRAVSS